MDTTTAQSIQAQQDALRPVRMFVGALTGALQGADQSVSGQDPYAYNIPGQYQTVGPWGYAQEGTPIATTRNGGIVVSPMMVMLIIGAAAALLWKH